MRANWQVVFVLSALVWVGCKAKGKPKPVEPEMEQAAQAMAWPDVPCPEGSDVSARMRLQDIIRWAGQAGGPAADRTQQKAAECLEHPTDTPIHREKVLRAWAKADQAHRHPNLPPEQKEELWNACADELTHGPNGS